VSQQTFDDAVRENMAEFDMDAESALQDAIEQFKAQGVSLSLIVKDAALYAGSGDGEHAVVAAIKKLEQLIADNSEDDALELTLKEIQSLCETDIATRVLASRSGAYAAVFSACTASRSNEKRLQICLNTLSALCHGQPDVLDEKGMDFLMELLQDYKSAVFDTLKAMGLEFEMDFDHANQSQGIDFSSEFLTTVVHVIRLTCIMHEENRQGFVSRSLISRLSSLLSERKSEVRLITEVCGLLRVLTSDDDVRVPFGKGHEHAKMIVTEEDTLRKIVDICKVQDNPGVLSELFLTLSRLSVRNEFCQEIMDLGALEMLLDALQKNETHQMITKHVLGLIKTIAGNDDVKIAVAKRGGIELILAAMSKHARHAGIADSGCGAVAQVCLRQPSHCTRAAQADAPEIISKAMMIHHAEKNVQASGCLAVRNLIARTRELVPSFLEHGAEAALRAAITTHKDCHDPAKAALRDLGCDVTLVERWKGEGHSIARD